MKQFPHWLTKGLLSAAKDALSSEKTLEMISEMSAVCMFGSRVGRCSRRCVELPEERQYEWSWYEGNANKVEHSPEAHRCAHWRAMPLMECESTRSTALSVPQSVPYVIVYSRTSTYVVQKDSFRRDAGGDCSGLKWLACSRYAT